MMTTMTTPVPAADRPDPARPASAPHPLHPPHWRAVQDQIADMVRSSPRFGLLTDFDGTLCAFRPYPELPRLPDRNRASITALSAALPVVAIISGRAALELRTVADLPGVDVVYIGNHGLEELKGEDVVVLPEAQAWEGPMTAFFHALGEPTIPGVGYQHKRITMSVTYRNAADIPATRLAIKARLDAINRDFGFHLHEGRTIWEVKPPIPLDKGTAVHSLVREYGLTSAIYLGDDITDIPALGTIRTLRGAGQIRGIAVSVLGETVVQEVIDAGDVLANSVEDVADLLEFIVAQIPGGTPRR